MGVGWAWRATCLLGMLRDRSGYNPCRMRKEVLQEASWLKEQLGGEPFQAWRRDIQSAQATIAQEKARSLRQLTPEQSLQLYRALWQCAHPLFDYSQPSPLVQRVQAVFQRCLERYTSEPAG